MTQIKEKTEDREEQAQALKTAAMLEKYSAKVLNIFQANFFSAEKDRAQAKTRKEKKQATERMLQSIIVMLERQLAEMSNIQMFESEQIIDAIQEGFERVRSAFPERAHFVERVLNKWESRAAAMA